MIYTYRGGCCCCFMLLLLFLKVNCILCIIYTKQYVLNIETDNLSVGYIGSHDIMCLLQTPRKTLILQRILLFQLLLLLLLMFMLSSSLPSLTLKACLLFHYLSRFCTVLQATKCTKHKHKHIFQYDSRINHFSRFYLLNRSTLSPFLTPYLPRIPPSSFFSFLPFFSVSFSLPWIVSGHNHTRIIMIESNVKQSS